MKLHKSIRKYAAFDLKKLNEFIELDSYQLISSHYNTLTIPKAFKQFTNYSFTKINLYQHKTDQSHLLHFISTNETRYLYIDSTIKWFHRLYKPAYICVTSSAHNYIIDDVELYYFKNGCSHNDYGPQTLEYKTSLVDKKFYLSHLKYIKNNCFYNKNGIISYTKTHNNTYIKFMKNNIKTCFYYYNNKIKISIYNNTNKCSIVVINAPTYKTKHYSKLLNNETHRLDGPAIISIKDNIEFKEWYINNKELPGEIFHYEKGLEKNIIKSDVLKAILFDREYGEFLKEKFNEVAQIDSKIC